MNSMLQSLNTALENLQPLQLEAITLLHTLRPQTGEWFSTNFTPEAKIQVIAATVELVAYTRRCSDMARRLSHLQPLPLRLPLPENSHEPR
jgi:hypothetical protein